MGFCGLDIARLIAEEEPGAYSGDPAAVERVTQALAKIIGAFLAKTLAQHGDAALADAVEKIAKAVELEARETVTTMLLLRDASDDPPDTIN